jgi:hypothetical protein
MCKGGLYLVVRLLSLLDLDAALGLQLIDLHQHHLATRLFLLVYVIRPQSLTNLLLDLIELSLSLRGDFL